MNLLVLGPGGEGELDEPGQCLLHPLSEVAAVPQVALARPVTEGVQLLGHVATSQVLGRVHQQLDGLLDDHRFERVDHDVPGLGVDHVAVRDAAVRPPAGHHLLNPAAHRALKDQRVFHLRHVGEERQRHPEHVRLGVDPTICGDDADLAALLDLDVRRVVHPAVDVLHRAADAVQLAEDDEVDLPGGDGRVHPVQILALGELPGYAAVRVDIHDHVVADAQHQVEPAPAKAVLRIEAETIDLFGRTNTSVKSDAPAPTHLLTRQKGLAHAVSLKHDGGTPCWDASVGTCVNLTELCKSV